MKTYSIEEGLTEEALVTKLRICQYHHLYLHTSLRNNSSGFNFSSYISYFEITTKICVVVMYFSSSCFFYCTMYIQLPSKILDIGK